MGNTSSTDSKTGKQGTDSVPPTSGIKASSSTASTKSNEINIPNHLHKYIIGTKGSVINEIIDKTGSKIDLDGDMVNVSGGDEAQCIRLIKEAVEPHMDKIDLDNSESLSFSIPPQGVSRIVGSGGATIKELQKTHRCVLNLDSDANKVTIQAESKKAAEKAKRAVMDELASHGWFFSKGQWTEKLPYEEEFASVRQEISDMSNKIHQLGSDSQKAFKSGDGSKAKELSNKMKELVKKRDAMNDKMHEDIFQFLNKDRPSSEIDLHGLHVDFALKKVEETLSKHPKESVTIIVGAGNHSDKGGAKIKPRIIRHLKEKKKSYKEINKGTLQVN